MRFFGRDSTGASTEASDATPAAAGGPMLRIDHLSIRFGGVEAVSDVSVVIDEPIVGVVGPNGAGKSTFLNGISGLSEIQGAQVTGSIRYQGVELRGKSADARARLGIGRSFQHPPLIPMLTVGEHLELAGHEAGNAEWTAGRVIDFLELGSWLHREVPELPYGVRKIFDLGRALIGGPELLLCDEPLSGLDELTRDEMISILARLRDEGQRVIVVEHDFPRVAHLADELVVLDFGRMVAQAAPERIAADPAVRRIFLGDAELGSEAPAVDERVQR